MGLLRQQSRYPSPSFHCRVSPLFICFELRAVTASGTAARTIQSRVAIPFSHTTTGRTQCPTANPNQQKNRDANNVLCLRPKSTCTSRNRYADYCGRFSTAPSSPVLAFLWPLCDRNLLPLSGPTVTSTSTE